MMVRLIAASVVIAAPLTFALGYWQGQHLAETPQASIVRLNPPVIPKPGYGAAAAAKYFAALNAPPPAPLLAGPTPPDVGQTFRHEVAAVITDRAPHIVLADGRQLARGQAYRDGWKVRTVSTDVVVLARGSETRSINLFSAPMPVIAPAVGTTVGGFGQISLTNGQRAGQISSGALTRILAALRAIGLPQATLDQLQRTLSAGSITPGQAIQIINTALRGRQVTQAQITSLVQAFAAAGVIPTGQTAQISGQLFNQQQSQQLQGILNGRDPGGGGFGGNGGFGGRRGFGGPGGGRGGLGLTAPTVSPANQLGQAPAQVAVSPSAQTTLDRATIQ
jgi:hypothetical protein